MRQNQARKETQQYKQDADGWFGPDQWLSRQTDSTPISLNSRTDINNRSGCGNKRRETWTTNVWCNHSLCKDEQGKNKFVGKDESRVLFEHVKSETLRSHPHIRYQVSIYQVCRLIISLELKNVWTEDTNLSGYLKPGESMRIDNAREKVVLR